MAFGAMGVIQYRSSAATEDPAIRLLLGRWWCDQSRKFLEVVQ